MTRIKPTNKLDPGIDPDRPTFEVEIQKGKRIGWQVRVNGWQTATQGETYPKPKVFRAFERHKAIRKARRWCDFKRRHMAKQAAQRKLPEVEWQRM
jgi:hypothetical protein